MDTRVKLQVAEVLNAVALLLDVDHPLAVGQTIRYRSHYMGRPPVTRTGVIQEVLKDGRYSIQRPQEDYPDLVEEADVLKVLGS